MIELFLNSFPLLMMGAMMTVKVLIFSAALSFSLGLIFGIFCSEEVKIPFVSPVLQFVTFILRAIPFYIHLLIVYFVFPDFLHINLDIFPASVIALGLCSSGYVSQIVRAGFNSIPKAQWESSFALGYNKVQSLFYFMLPQMLRNVLPNLNNELESILKSTAILSSIGMLELTRVGMNIVSRDLSQPLEIYLIVALFYVSMSLIFNFVSKYLEKRLQQVRV